MRACSLPGVDANLYSSTHAAVPGLTVPRQFRDDVCDIETALRKEDDTEQARALLAIADAWFQDNSWYYRETAECQAFYAGAHWGYWNDKSNQWIAVPRFRPRNEVRMSVPAYKAIVDQATAMLTQDDPHFDVTAAKSEGRDTAASEAAAAFTKFWWTRHRLTDKYRLTARETFHTGTSFIYVRWDPSRGEFAPGMPMPKFPPEIGPDGSLVMEPGGFQPTGDVTFEILPTDSVAPDPAASGDQEGQGIFLRVQVTRQQLRIMFPEKYEEAPSAIPGVADAGGNFESSTIARWSPITESGHQPQPQSADVVWLYTMFARRSQDLPVGAMRIFADGVIFYKGDNPVYSEPGTNVVSSRLNWPILAARCDERQGAYFGLGRGVAMIPLNKAINGLWSKALQHMAMIANAKVTLPAGLAADWTDEVGSVLRLPRTIQSNLIGFVNPPPMPDYGLMIDRAKAEMEYEAGVGAATQGQLPSSDTSGIALGRLQQRDMTRIAPVKRSLDATWADAISLALSFWRRWASGAVKVLVAGENKQTQIKEFDAKTFSETTDVQPFNNTFLPQDPSARMMWLSSFAQTIGSIQDPQIKMLLIRLANVKDVEPFLTNMNPDDDKARRNNLVLLAGGDPMTLPCDNALVHKMVLEEMMKSEQWEQVVRQEEAQTASTDPLTGQPRPGVSALKTKSLNLWNYFNMIAQGMNPMQAGMPQPGGSPAPTPGLPMPETLPSAGAPQTEDVPVPAAA